MVNGKICLKGVDWGQTGRVPHEYYTQVQIAMRCTGRQWCDFVVWWPSGLLVIRIDADTAYQDKVIQACEATFFDVFLPTAILSQACQKPAADVLVDLSCVEGFEVLRDQDVKYYIAVAGSVPPPLNPE